MKVSHTFIVGSARFDEDNLVSHAGLVPVLGLAEQTRLRQIIGEKVSIKTSRIRSGAANPVPKLLGVIAGMCAGADSIEDLDVLRAGGMPILFEGVYAPSTLGTLLREFSFGHARQLESVLPCGGRGWLPTRSRHSEGVLQVGCRIGGIAQLAVGRGKTGAS